MSTKRIQTQAAKTLNIESIYEINGVNKMNKLNDRIVSMIEELEAEIIRDKEGRDDI